MSEFKKCPNGHYYEGDFCPHCGETAVNAPLCPHCGELVRKRIHGYPYRIRSIEGGAKPWNYEWNGRCESCGFDFTITMRQKMSSSDEDRYTEVRVASETAESGYVDVFMGLSGVEIEQRNSIDGVKKTFISTNELKYLMSALKDSPILEQIDWYEDRT